MRGQYKHVTIAVLRPAACQVAQKRDALFFEERRHLVIERLGGRQRVLQIIELETKATRV